MQNKDEQIRTDTREILDIQKESYTEKSHWLSQKETKR